MIVVGLGALFVKKGRLRKKIAAVALLAALLELFVPSIVFLLLKYCCLAIFFLLVSSIHDRCTSRRC